MGALSSPQTLVAGGGELIQPSREDIREQFDGLCERLDYTAYHDLEMPVIETGDDLGWIGVEVQAVATDKASGTQINSQWAWIMVAKKEDGTWRHAGNASNRLTPR